MKHKSLEAKRKHFLETFTLAQRYFEKSTTRLAAEGWDADWKTIVSIMMSAQTRDEVTIPVAEKLFEKYPTVQALAKAKVADVRNIISRLNYCNTKARHVVQTADILVNKYGGKVPRTIEELIELPGVGRKTANLVLSELYAVPGICVDTHVHRISNLFGWVQTKTPHQTELELQKVVPKHLWSKVNRILVLWGKKVPGRDTERFLAQVRDTSTTKNSHW